LNVLPEILLFASPFLAATTEAPSSDTHWPVLTVGLAIFMLFFTWWQQTQHRRKMEDANDELKRAFEALRESETKFRLLFERSADAILLMDPGKGPKFIDCNDAAVRLMGYRTKEEFLRLELGGLSTEFQPDGELSVPKAVEVVKQAIRHGTHRFEWRNKRADGGMIMTEVSMTAVQVAKQPLIVTIARDVTERHRAEQALRENQQLLSSVLDNISEGIYRSSPERGLIFANKAYLRMFGYDSMDDLRSVPRENLYADVADRKRLISQLERTGQFLNEEIVYKRKNGTTFWALANSIAIFEPGTHRLDYHVGVISDITERKKAQDEIRRLNQDLERRIVERTAELQASEARLRTLVEHAPEAIVVFDAENGKFVTVNENATRLLGRDRETLLGLTPVDVSPEFQQDGRRTVECVAERIGQVKRGETPVFEWLHNRPGGTEVPCEIRLVRLPGERTLVRASIIDTTERRRREKVQRATYQISEAVHTARDLESLYERIHSIIRTLMPADNFYLALHHPETGLYHFDYHVDRIDATPPPREMSEGLSGYVLRTGKPLLATRESMLDPKSEWRVVSGIAAAVWLGVPLAIGGRIFGIMAVRDHENQKAYAEEEKQILSFVAEQIALAIERKGAEQALRESEEKHRALFEATSQGVMLHDEQEFLEVNPAALRILGYDRPDQVIGKHPAETSAAVQIDGQTADALARKFISQCMECGTAQFEWVAKSASGKEIPLEVTLTRIQMSGRPIIQAVIVDITERKKAEAELLRSLAREKELSALKTSFVSMVSHEFRTPLGIIMSSSEILHAYFEQLEKVEREQHLHSIQKNTRRMANLMEEVLLLSRVEAGKLTLDPQALDLPALCRRLVDEVLSATNRRSSIELTVNAEVGEAYLDERLLRHILTNLLTNAVKYSSEGAPVKFLVARLATKVRFDVIDTGIGIPEEDQKWLFNAFQRGRNVGTIPGTGLGLVIVKRCIELHRGTIRIHSAAGRGTRVEVEVPLALAALDPKVHETIPGA
jgi:PAS domain S-box-containing protein